MGINIENTVIERATTTAKSHGIDTEIHLHSPLHYETICKIPSIGIIGVESAANPSYLSLIDKKDLEEYDKFLRVGISRTDISKMVALINEELNINAWKDIPILEKAINDMEAPSIIEKRLEKIYNMFGERIKYAGPDCGLGSWQTQNLAFNLLKNTDIAIKEFQKKQKV